MQESSIFHAYFPPYFISFGQGTAFINPLEIREKANNPTVKNFDVFGQKF